MSPDSKITDIFPRLQEHQKKALQKLGIVTAFDLLYHFPSRYEDKNKFRPINALKKGDDAVIYGRLSKLKTAKAFHKKIAMAEGFIEDATGKIKIVWYNQPYLAKMLQSGAAVKIMGRVAERKGELYVSNPHVENSLGREAPGSIFSGSDGGESGGDKENLLPVYPESRGLTSNWLESGVKKIIRAGVLEMLHDPIPEKILRKYNLPDVKSAMIFIHLPRKSGDALSARKRFAFEEVFVIQLKKQKSRFEYKKLRAFAVKKEPRDLENFTKLFPFKMTASQKKAIKDILADFAEDRPMTRLLEGDVGSGKTAVAAAAAYAVSISRPLLRGGSGAPERELDFGNLQTAYMVPTEILAKQHFESFIKHFRHFPLQVGLITSSGCRKFPSKINSGGWTDISRSQFLKWVANGEIAVVVGTHSLIQKSVRFKHLAFAIIDEQHRFGTAQRQKLVGKDGVAPHLLSMTATPIPRTLALTIYGDLDLSLLLEMPEGRKPVETSVVMPSGRKEVYEKIKTELENGRQAYVVCPRIEEPDPEKENAVNAKSAKEEAKRLKKEIFPEYEIGVLHGKMKPSEKDSVMKNFESGKTDILVATSVVEVGVNVPNATSIIIEGAERFGLAQLHQLRGRILRSSHQSYCFMFTESRGKSVMERLKAVRAARSGFELAEKDLEFRGSGELYGKKQWGLSDLAMEAIRNIKMVEAAREEAKNLIEKNPDLSDLPTLAALAESKENEIHFE